MPAAASSTNQPNAGRSRVPGTRRPSRLPSRIPTTARAVKASSSTQSKLLSTATSPRKPNSDLAAMMVSEVPTATRIGRRANTASAGTMAKPPPAPTTPVSTPMTVPSSAISGTLTLAVGCDEAGRPPPRAAATGTAAGGAGASGAAPPLPAPPAPITCTA